MAENEIERLSENESNLEDDLDSVSVSSAEPDNLEDVERLANEIFGESEDHEFHGFYNDETVREIFGDSDDEAEPFEGFCGVDVHFKMPQNFEENWTKELPNVFDRLIREDFVAPEPGPTIERPNNFTYLDYFQLFITNETIEQIAVFMGRNARHRGKTEAEFTPPTFEELKAYFGFYIATNDFIVTPNDHRLFMQDETKWLFHTPRFGTVFTRKRYEEVKHFLHFCDPYTLILDRASPDYDPLYKVCLFLTEIQEKFKTLWTPKNEVSVDEAMIPFKGRLGIKQFILNKPVRFSIKLWELCKLATGYCFKFDVYIGKGKADDPLDIGKAASVVTNLSKGSEHQNYNICMDNYYSSVPLYLALVDKGIGACGTI